MKQYNSIVNKYSINDNEKKKIFSNFLNLGEMLYYGDYNYRLKDKIILDVNWFIESLYMTINWVSKNKTNGSFIFNDLEQVFKEKEFNCIHDLKIFFLDSLNYFNIIFEFEENTFYFPNLLEYHKVNIEEYYNKSNYHHLKVAMKKIQQYIFYNLLVQINKKYSTKAFYKNLIIFNYNEIDIAIYNDDNNGDMYIYIQKTKDKKIFDILELLLKDLKDLFNSYDLDIKIHLDNDELVSVIYLKKHIDFDKNEFLTPKGKIYKINDIFCYEEEKEKDSNILKIEKNDGDIFINGTKNII